MSAVDRLYDVGAYGLAAYARARFRVRALGEPFSLAPRTLVVSSHRSDDDVPVLVACLYPQAHGRWRRNARLHFAVRDDLFVPGFFAGYPKRLPAALRRALVRIDVGPVLRTRLPCHAIRSATHLRLAEFLREHPDEPLAELLPEALAMPFGTARTGRDALRGRYAHELWRVVTPEELDTPAAAVSWARRRAGALDDFRELVGVIRGGDSLAIFPEGRPSPDGDIGPILDGVTAIVRRARPARIVALAPAYDPLVRGRTHAFLAISAPRAPTDDAGELLALLRRTTPLTVGDSVATALADHADPERRLAEDVEAARDERRPYEPELDDPDVRRKRMAIALGAAGAQPLERLVRTYRSARA
jgi:1-acyl-sn-glycerol-3-phosphate acyltransferase